MESCPFFYRSFQEPFPRLYLSVSDLVVLMALDDLLFWWQRFFLQFLICSFLIFLNSFLNSFGPGFLPGLLLCLTIKPFLHFVEFCFLSFCRCQKEIFLFLRAFLLMFNRFWVRQHIGIRIARI